MVKLRLKKSFTEKSEVFLDSYFEQEQELSEDMLELIRKFLSYGSIKEALKSHFKIKSSQVVNFCQDNMIRKNGNQVCLNVDYFCIIESLSYIFSRGDKFNHSDFMEVIKSHKTLAVLSPFYSEARRLDKFLKDNFTPSQIKTVLLNTQEYAEIRDLTGMYFQEEELYKRVLKNISFKDKQDLVLCHDILAEHVKNIKLENFELKQETHYPQISELGGLDKEYSFSIPKSHKDLVVWGTELGHCIGAKMYADQAYNGVSLLIGIKKEDQIKYTLEIRNRKINQIQGFSRSRPSDSLMKKIKQELTNKNLLF